MSQIHIIWRACGVGACPALAVSETGKLLVVGRVVTTHDPELAINDGEAIVELPMTPKEVVEILQENGGNNVAH